MLAKLLLRDPEFTAHPLQGRPEHRANRNELLRLEASVHHDLESGVDTGQRASHALHAYFICKVHLRYLQGITSAAGAAVAILIPPEATDLAARSLVTDVLARYGDSIAADAAKLRTKHPGLSDRELAHTLVCRYRRRAGCVGAATSSGGVITLAVTVPAGLLTSWVIATKTVLSIANVYSYQPDDEQLLFDLLMVLAADSVVTTLREVTTMSAQRASLKTVEKHVTREVMAHINRVVPRTARTKAGQNSITSFTKLAPLVGAPIGYGFEHLFVTTIGKRAIEWYDPEAATLDAVAA